MSYDLTLNNGSLWVLLAALAVGVGLAVWTYQRTVPRTTTAKRTILIVLRSLGIAALLFAIFQPVLTSTTTNELVPKVALALDNSQSMQLPQQGLTTTAQVPPDATRRAAMITSVQSVIPQDIRSDASRLEAYLVGDNTLEVRGGAATAIDSLAGRTTVTNLSSVFNAVREARKTRNIEAVVLYTDGAFTAGSNPVYAAQQLGVPVYAVGLGDSSEIRDISLTELFTNEVATIGVAQPVDMTLHVSNSRAGERAQIYVYADQERVHEQVVTLKGGSYDESFSFRYTPTKEGTIKLTARVSALSQEITDKNNLRIAYVKVLRNKFRVALLAGAPSSDVSFLRQYYTSNPSVELVTFIQKSGSEFYEGPPTAEKLRDIDLVVLAGFPIAQTSDQSLALVRQLVTTQSKPLLYIPSRTVDNTKLQQLGDALPFRVSSRLSQTEIKVSPYVDPDRYDHPLLKLTGQMKDKMSWDGLAPLFKSESSIEPKPETEVLAEATIQGVQIGDPLIMTRQVGESRSIAINGYGIWQWRLTSFGRELAFQSTSRLRDTNNVAFSALDIFLTNALRWLTTRDDQKRVNIAPTRRFYEAGERIDVAGQVYDESFVPVENATATIRITGGTLKSPMALTLDPIGNGRYTVALPQGLPAGDYAFVGEANRRGALIGRDDGRFNVGEFNVEFAEPRMRNDILRELAARTGGKFYTVDNAGTLMEDIRTNPRFAPREITTKADFELWNAWPLLALALTAFAIEWFMRKRLGML
ncbi:MAG TPA: hypothetical protein VFH43_14055 [Candidatus Kapabacteria bacterium]|nr:hypothetical protein [Candidatus Kapabacteria bacterium]